MSKLSADKVEVLAYIDTILTLIEKYPTLNLGNIADDINLGVSVNPFDFLLSIISKKVSDSEMIDWLVNLLTASLPAIELGVKGILLSNLKQTIDCNNDPRIPDWVRQDINSGEPNKNRGFIFNVKNIDYTNMLSNSPMSEVGQMKYFGTKTYYKINGLDDTKYYSYYDAVLAIDKLANDDTNINPSVTPTINDIVKYSEIDNVYELARAKDFNAFLWFVINKANFSNSTDIDVYDLSNYKKDYDLGSGIITKRPFSISGTSVLDCFNGEHDNSDTIPTPFSPGSVITQEKVGFKNFSLCINMKTTNKLTEYKTDVNQDNSVNDIVTDINSPKIFNFSFVPVTSYYKSANWYVNSGTYFNFILPEDKRVARDYAKDFAICNIEPLGIKELNNAMVNGELFYYTAKESYIRFTILPSPLIHTPSIINGESPLNFKRLLFNSKGEPDKNGKYTVNYLYRDDNKELKETVYTLSDGQSQVIVKWDGGGYSLIGDNSKINLIECYPGLTVYDFNYNYVMGMQLFDPAVVASQLIEMATNISMYGSIGANVSINKTETAYQMRIAEIVKNIVESTAFEASDCFYTFSNDKFDSMLEEAELKRAQGYNFETSVNETVKISLDDAYSILSEFDDNATLEENKYVITRAITTATAKITDEVLPEDRYNVKLTLIQELIKSVVFIIVDSLITPKIILLFEVNKQLMGGHDENLSLEDFINSLSGLITSIVIEIRDLILQELLNWAMDIVSELIEKLSSMLVLEQIDYYTRLMVGLLKACNIRLPKRDNLSSSLDYVDYADIDEIDKPITSEC